MSIRSCEKRSSAALARRDGIAHSLEAFGPALLWKGIAGHIVTYQRHLVCQFNRAGPNYEQARKSVSQLLCQGGLYCARHPVIRERVMGHESNDVVGSGQRRARGRHKRVAR
jgi:hypothetical protein